MWLLISWPFRKDDSIILSVGIYKQHFHGTIYLMVFGPQKSRYILSNNIPNVMRFVHWVLSIARQKAHLGHEQFLAPQNWNGNLEPQVMASFVRMIESCPFPAVFFRRFQFQPSIFIGKTMQFFHLVKLECRLAWMPWRKLRIAI